MSKRAIEHAIIMGAGLVGSLMAAYLAKRGYRVTMYEKRPDPRKGIDDGGRSINLALSHRGFKALREVGIEDEVRRLVVPMRGRMIHGQQGDPLMQPYGKQGQAINSVGRHPLNAMLIDLAESMGAEIYFNYSCKHLTYPDRKVTLIDPEGTEFTTSADLVLGTDGAYSAVRNSMAKHSRFNYSQYYIPHGYKELTIPPTSSGDFAMEPHALHVWPRKQFMLIALPNPDKTFTATLFFPHEGELSFNTLTTREEVGRFFNEQFPDVVPLIPNLLDEYFGHPTSSMVTVKCFPWVRNNVVILGDASHAIVPFFGQGMNSGFEDCRVFNKMLDDVEAGKPIEAMLQDFQAFRKPDADAISDLALRNFVEMRDKVADPQFLLRKKIEVRLNREFPDQWVPLYTMVTFSDMRYSEAMHQGQRQELVMDEVMKRPDVDLIWETMDLAPIIERLKQIEDLPLPQFVNYNQETF